MDASGGQARWCAPRLLPARRGASDKAEALFSFESLAVYERYRARFGKDPEFVAADSIRDSSGCVVRYERTFMRPLLPTD
ncbi:NIPSNAP family protein [Micromonospora trifolii]|uniref:NIPSNAP family protein n=1 Tax=Micromonospora trifolii TaxID=2911208 RepID=UPI003D2EE039